MGKLKDGELSDLLMLVKSLQQSVNSFIFFCKESLSNINLEKPINEQIKILKTENDNLQNNLKVHEINKNDALKNYTLSKETSIESNMYKNLKDQACSSSCPIHTLSDYVGKNNNKSIENEKKIHNADTNIDHCKMTISENLTSIQNLENAQNVLNNFIVELQKNA